MTKKLAIALTALTLVVGLAACKPKATDGSTAPSTDGTSTTAPATQQQ